MFQITTQNRVAARSLLVSTGVPAAEVRTWPLARLSSELAAAVENGRLSAETVAAAIAPSPLEARSAAPARTQPEGTAEGTSNVQDAVAKAISNALAPVLESLSRPSLDVEKVREIIREEIDARVPRRIEVKQGEVVRTVEGRTHEAFPEVLAAISCGIHVLLVGPSGSGKSHMAKQVAEALGRNFYSTGAIATKHELIGYVPPNSTDGKAIRTPFRDAFEHGGVFSWDDVDGSDPRALVAFNEALANGRFAFPDGMVYAHPDFVCIASANTWGLGATADYVGRAKLDAATLTRFVRIYVDYDEALERDLVGREHEEWVRWVQRLRAAVSRLGIKVLITPRQTIQGAKLLAYGLDRAKVERMTVFAGMDDATITKLCNEARQAA